MSAAQDDVRLRAEVPSPSVAEVATLSERVIYLKALPLRDLSDVSLIEKELSEGNILIVRIVPLARKSVDDVKKAVNELRGYAESIKGDIARLGEERIVLTPPTVKIWKAKAETASA
ncbi:MAG: cell division protein SepF [Candidatus Bathyarchaeia archaeon]